MKNTVMNLPTIDFFVTLKKKNKLWLFKSITTLNMLQDYRAEHQNLQILCALLNSNFIYAPALKINVVWRCINATTYWQTCIKALRAIPILVNNINKYDVTPYILIQLFYYFVGSILNYASPVLGFSNSKDIKRVHLNFRRKTKRM